MALTLGRVDIHFITNVLVTTCDELHCQGVSGATRFSTAGCSDDCNECQHGLVGRVEFVLVFGDFRPRM